MTNFYIAIVTIGMSVTIAQAGYTYTIDGRMTEIHLDVKELGCSIGGPKCWLLRWRYLVEYNIAASILMYDDDNNILHMRGDDSIINLCGTYQNGTVEELLKALLVEALFPSERKECPFNGENPYLVFEQLHPVTITMNEKLNCGDYFISADITVEDHEIYKLSDDHPDGEVVIRFTIPDSDNCNRL